MNNEPPEPERFAVTAITRFAHTRLLEVVANFGTIKALASELGICDATLSAWINLRTMPACGKVDIKGRRKADPRTKRAVGRLCELAGASPEELFPGYVREKLTGKAWRRIWSSRLFPE